MKSDTNVFGQRICTREECPLWYTGSEQCGCDGFCNALMDFTGRVAEIDGKVTYGLLRMGCSASCHLALRLSRTKHETR